MVGHPVQVNLNIVPQTIGIIQKLICHIMQNIQIIAYLVQSVRRGIQPEIRLCLPDNPADILSSVYRCVVVAAQKIAGLSACHTADIITDMRIANLAIVVAALHHTIAETDHAANIRIGHIAALGVLL